MEAEKIDGDISIRIITSYVLITMHHHDAINDLIKSNRPISASALIRPLVEAFVRATWLSLNENHKLVKKAIRQLEKGKDDFPKFWIMIDMIDEEFGENLLTVKLKDIMRVFHSFTHGGASMVSRCLTEDTVGPNFSTDELISILDGTSYHMQLTVLAYASKVGNKKLADEINLEIKKSLKD
ncbi:hypothetical protein JHD47_07685 [Sulfurimonas sp. SAG-AH-194-L11]|nr:hypothetical protein [Sulfurimonas sp. SAG-AH-194-L11]MDF1877695.1 hypothetical protein [Sulfurimonas sp. SAG-AH-194-L11]